MNYITLLIVNTYADENYGSTAQKWKGIILPDRSGTADDCHESILVAQTGGKQDLLKSLDISIYQIPTHVNTTSLQLPGDRFSTQARVNNDLVTSKIFCVARA